MTFFEAFRCASRVGTVPPAKNQIVMSLHATFMEERALNNTVEREIDLKDLFYRVVKQWRWIIVGAIIIGVLAGLYKLGTGMLTLADEEKMAEAMENYQIDLDDYEATGRQLKTDIRDLRSSSAIQQEYNEKSVLMSIDPKNEWVGTFVMYVDSRYQIDPSLSYQNTDKTYRLIMAYNNYLTGGELYGEIIGQTDIVDEVRFLTEILTAEVDNNSASITVKCLGKSEENVQEILGLVKQAIQNKYQAIYDTIGEHDINILVESVYATIDVELDTLQKDNRKIVSDYAIQMGEINEELAEWGRSAKPRAEFGMDYTIRQAVKYLVYGGIIGFVFMAMLSCASYVLGSTMHTDGDWQLMGIPVLAYIHPMEKRKKLWKIDCLIDRFIGGKPERTDPVADCKLAAVKLCNVMREKNMDSCYMTGNLPAESMALITGAMNEAGTDVTFVDCGNVLGDPEAAKKLEASSEVVLLGKFGKTKVEDVQRVLTILGAWGKKITGAVVVVE